MALPKLNVEKCETREWEKCNKYLKDNGSLTCIDNLIVAREILFCQHTFTRLLTK